MTGRSEVSASCFGLVLVKVFENHPAGAKAHLILRHLRHD